MTPLPFTGESLQDGLRNRHGALWTGLQVGKIRLCGGNNAGAERQASLREGHKLGGFERTHGVLGGAVGESREFSQLVQRDRIMSKPLLVSGQPASQVDPDRGGADSLPIGDEQVQYLPCPCGYISTFNWFHSRVNNAAFEN